MAYTDIDKPSDYFDTLIYSGNGSNPRTLSGLDFQPNWTWLKNRTDNNGHTLADSVRTANKTLDSSGTGVEITDKNDGHLDAFTSDGFTVGAGSSGDARVNDGSHTYVAWNWKAGTSFTNDASGTGIGTIDSAGSVNTDAGFSIVSYTGTGSAGTIKHGLSTTPSMIIIKNRSSVYDWTVGHNSLGWTNVVFLNATTASQGDTQFNNTAPTSSVFSIGTPLMANKSGDSIIAYCFAEKKGYSKFSSYIGNGNADGTFVYLGFKPAFVMVKNTSATENWIIFDNKRPGRNLTDALLKPNTDTEETATGVKFDLLSNGFKARVSDAEGNSSGHTFIYMAFAENPFVTSTGVPATAR